MIRELTDAYRWELIFIKIERGMFPNELPFNQRITLETYFRLALPELLPKEVERVLYLDADLIVNKPLDELYEMDFENQYMIVCKDVTSTVTEYLEQPGLFDELKGKPGFCYFNAGVLLLNLKRLREKYSFRILMDYALKIKDCLKFHDQDLLNYVLGQEVKYAEAERFNLIARTAYNSGYRYPWVEENTSILHYAGPKPWEHKEVRYELECFWWDYAKKTPFYTELLEDLVWTEIKTGYMDQLYRQLKRENEELHQIVNKCMGVLKATLG